MGPDLKLANLLAGPTPKPTIYAAGVAQRSDCSNLIEVGNVDAVEMLKGISFHKFHTRRLQIKFMDPQDTRSTRLNKRCNEFE